MKLKRKSSLGRGENPKVKRGEPNGEQFTKSHPIPRSATKNLGRKGEGKVDYKKKKHKRAQTGGGRNQGRSQRVAGRVCSEGFTDEPGKKVRGKGAETCK